MLLQIASAVLHILFALPTPLRRLIAGKPIRIDGQELDLDTQLMLSLRHRIGSNGVGHADVPTLRKQYNLFTAVINGPKVRSVDTRDLVIPGTGPLPGYTGTSVWSRGRRCWCTTMAAVSYSAARTATTIYAGC